MSEALRLEGVIAGYGETIVLEDNSFALPAGESLSVIGRNGVGKTTLLATIMGHTRQRAGRIMLEGADISGEPIHRRAMAGLGLVPQEREVFPSLSVHENLDIAKRPGDWTMEAVFELFPNLAERADHSGNQLSGGEQQMLAIARALVGNPSVLLMDEPTEGLAPVIIENLVAAMHSLRGTGGLAILLVEQHTKIALDFSERILVMDRGRIVYDGDSAELKANPEMLDQLIGFAGADQKG